MAATNRRGFLKHGLVAAGGLGLGVAAWSRFARNGEPPAAHHQLGPLYPVNDQSTGLPILKLPKGFRYHSFAWAGETLGDGYPSPESCDGMGVVANQNGIVTLIRNHELSVVDDSACVTFEQAHEKPDAVSLADRFERVGRCARDFDSGRNA